ncbi:MerR family transcriptional regulator [Xylocopilactobacillus apis]|uniref:MerR family transcriptional regulator n=1 Tax=Xylocopilactobacillus apis TaxID=2932183 RepID=A0AAU9CW13_9LACO|nr:MerR family transcriptional regulator [Xylocopilactobacillus apis]BDR55524.1 MerR family transcriptional regulator [Xylocopilactobacillus apis]
MTYYTVSELAKISGVTARTIRYYGEIGLLEPAEIRENDYRIYTNREVDRLQQILYFRNFGFKLAQIKELLEKPDYDVVENLKIQQIFVREEANKLKLLADSIDLAISYYQGEKEMSDPEKFQTFKDEWLKQNEEKYGDELREKYDEDEIREYNENFSQMSESKFEKLKKAEAQLFEDLNLLLKKENIDLDSSIAKDAFESHQKWLKIINPSYTKEYHCEMAEVYLADERFAQYYNNRTDKDSVKLLVEIIRHYAE